MHEDGRDLVSCGRSGQKLCCHLPGKPDKEREREKLQPRKVTFLTYPFILPFLLSLLQVDITQVPEFNKMYELYDPCTTMFFFRNKHIMVDLGTGNNNKISWAIEDKQELIDIIEVVYRGAKKGRGLVVSPKDYSTKYKY